MLIYHRMIRKVIHFLFADMIVFLSCLCMKLAAPDDHLIVSSSLDRTLRVWDLRGYYSVNSITHSF
jgi:WD40 repeat protein